MPRVAPDKGSPVAENLQVFAKQETSSDIESGAPRQHSIGLDDATRMQIVYRDLKYTVQVKDKETKSFIKKDILKGLNGVIQPGRTTAVMGASGAGKTTFLNVLAGMHSGMATVDGTISVNGDVADGNTMRRISGFVHQEDVILETMTVREALMFAAELKLPREMSRSEKERRAMAVADMLNLRKALDNLVGSSLIKGISGGEKRRLSLGMEMITNPSILFLDEPTSGLDSFTAYKVARILRNVAHRYGRTIVCTIHQPSSEVFNIFDDLIVLAEGEVVYHGPVQEMVSYFKTIGYECPNNFNPADFLFMDVLNAGGSGGDDDKYDFIAANQDDAAARAKAKEQESARMRQIINTWNASQRGETMTRSLTDKTTKSVGIDASAILQYAAWWIQFRLLAVRAAKNAWRNDLILKGKLAQTVILSLVVGLVYLKLGDDEQSIQDRQGSLFFIIVQMYFGAVMGTLTVFGAEKAVFQREFSGRLYGLPAYFISRTVVNLPAQIIMPILSSVIMYWMVGYQNTPEKYAWFMLILILIDNCGAAMGVFVSCIFNDIAVALTIMPLFLLPLMVFSGFFVNQDTLGWWFRWISYISPMKYGFVALAKNEFSGLTLTCNPTDSGCGPNGTKDGQSVINLLGFDNEGSVGQNAGILFALMWGFFLMAYVALWFAVRRQLKA